MDFVAALTALLGSDAVLCGDAVLPFCVDQRNRYREPALAVALPRDTAEVAEVVKLCSSHQIAIVPQGGNTSLCGASVPVAGRAQIVMNLSRLNRIREVDAVNYTMTVEAGCILGQLREVAALHNRLFPLALTATQHVCEIGGNISTNAGGIGVLRYGNARDLILGLEVVLPDGQVWDGLRSLRKNNTGYDLKHLFIGAEGTLGIITAAVLKLVPRPQAMASACVAIANPDVAVRLLAHIRSCCGDTLSGFELVSRSCMELVFKHIANTQEPFAQSYPYYVMIQQDDVLNKPLAAALCQAIVEFGEDVLDFTVTEEELQAENWWILRKSINEAQKREGLSIKHDISVPVSKVAEFIALADQVLNQHYPQARIVTFGHMGDGNIHYNVSCLDAEMNVAFIAQHEKQINHLVYEVLRQLDGSISAEHGLGQLKRDVVRHYKQPLEMELMQRIKNVLDPQGLMNPGKVL